MSKKNSTSEIWGGRFSSGPSAVMEAINASIDIDKRMWREDIDGSLAHAAMLAKQGIISADDERRISEGLNQITDEISQGKFQFRTDLEDIHMNIEARLKEIVGDAAGRLHTARSRNDQVATDFRLWCRRAAQELTSQVADLQGALVRVAGQHADTIMPGFTHLQTAQPVTFGHHCLAFVEMLERDKGRMRDAAERMNECPLGAAALAGTSFPLDRELTSARLGFAEPCRNSLDAVSARDFAVELMAAIAICGVHVSRLAEEIVVWSSARFNFITLPDDFSTGSSIMPQKKNPDAAELCRAKSGRIIGDLNALLIVLKGLPLAYSKDMQEDKEQTFDAVDALTLCLLAMTGMIGGLSVNAEAMRQSAATGFSTATDLADWLVRQLGMPFREAHHVTGTIVALAESKGCDLPELSLDDMKSVHGAITADVFSVLSVENSVASRTSFGGTAPDNVRAQVKFWKEKLEITG